MNTAKHLAETLATAKEWVLNFFTEINPRDEYGDTLLHEAARYGYDHLVARLIEKGTNINERGRFQRTPLHEAARYGREKVVRYLLGKRANIHAIDIHANTPLHDAVKNERPSYYPYPANDTVSFINEKVVAYLIEQGANLNARDGDDHTPLYIAVQGKNMRVLPLLLAHGAYSYRDAATEDAFKSWEVEDLSSEEGIVCGIAMLAAGVNLNQAMLPERLQVAQTCIETMIENLLSPLHLSRTVCHATTPHILRALPRVIHCLESIEKFKQDASFIESEDKLATLGVSVKELVESPEKLSEKLMKLYQLEPLIVDYLLKDCKDRLKEYKTLYKQLQQPWEEDVPLPFLEVSESFRERALGF